MSFLLLMWSKLNNDLYYLCMGSSGCFLWCHNFVVNCFSFPFLNHCLFIASFSSMCISPCVIDLIWIQSMKLRTAIIWNSILAGFANLPGRFKRAHYLFDEMLELDTVSYYIMIINLLYVYKNYFGIAYVLLPIQCLE